MSRPSHIRHLRGEDGAVLLVALVFLGVAAVLVTSVISLTGTNVASVTVTRELAAKRYAADAGLKYAIQQLRSNPEYCDDDIIDPPSDLLGPDSDNTPQPTLSVTCTVTNAAEIDSARGFALITNDSDPAGLQVNIGGPEAVNIGGPVYLASRPDPLPLDVTAGNVWVKQPVGSCPMKPAQLLLDSPPHDYDCVAGDAPDPAPGLPSLPTAVTGGLPVRVDPDGCAVFRPGTYKPPFLVPVVDAVTGAITGTVPAQTQDSPISGFSKSFFASGVYYFEDTDLIVRSHELFGGDAGLDRSSADGAPEAVESTGTPCSSSLDVAGSTGHGVTFVLGGSSRLIADNPSGLIELFTRTTPAGDPIEPTDGVSIMTVRSTGAGYKVSDRDYCEVVVGVANDSQDYASCNLRPGGGQTLSFVVHGMTYAPDGQVLIRNSSGESMFKGGLVAGRLLIGTSANIGGFEISVPSQSIPRKVRITAIASGADGTDQQVTATADVEIDDRTDAATVTARFSGQD